MLEIVNFAELYYWRFWFLLLFFVETVVFFFLQITVQLNLRNSISIIEML